MNRSKSSVHGMEQTIAIADRDFDGLCYVNLVDFDALWGHRRNPQGYGDELERFDVKLGELLGHLRSDDLLMITADHGNDPTYKGTDHTREKVPLLVYSPSLSGYGQLDEQDTFGVIGATIADNYAYLYYADDCEKVSKQHLDSTEFLEVKEYTEDEINDLIKNNEFVQPIHLMGWLMVKKGVL